MEEVKLFPENTLLNLTNESSNMSSSPSDEDSMFDCSADQKLISTLPVQLGFSFLYAIIFTLGFFGNLLVSIVVVRNRAMHTVTNFFILNLAVSDVVMCLFAVPFTPLQSFTGKWLFGDFLCTLFPFSQGVSVYISTLTLTIIALDRFVVIIYPFRARMQIKTSVLLIIIIDLLAAAFTTPYAFHVAIVEGSDGEDRCNETWDGLKRTIYGAFTNITQFVLPFVTIILCYTAIIRKLGQRSAHRPGGARRSAQREEQERARNQRTNRMLISMVVVFGICWLPLNIINFVADLDLIPIYCWQYHHFFFFVCHLMAMSSTCYNPFLYGWYNESFQKEFVQFAPILRFVCGSGTSARQAVVADDLPLTNLNQHKVTQELGHNIDTEAGNGNGTGHHNTHATSNKLSAVNIDRETTFQLLVPNGMSQSGSSVVSAHNDNNGNTALPLQPQQLISEIPIGIIVTNHLVVETN